MPLQINLYHEILTQAQLRRRDPLKLGMMAIGAVAVLFAGYYFYRLSDVNSTRAEAEALSAEWAKLEPEEKSAKEREATLQEQIRLTSALTKRINSRFFWAPVLEDLFENVSPEVQVRAFAGDAGEVSLRKVSMALDGMAVGPQPRKTAEELRTAVYEVMSKNNAGVESTFKALDDGPDVKGPNEKVLPSAVFAIQFSMERPVLQEGDKKETAAK